MDYGANVSSSNLVSADHCYIIFRGKLTQTRGRLARFHLDQGQGQCDQLIFGPQSGIAMSSKHHLF